MGNGAWPGLARECVQREPTFYGAGFCSVVSVSLDSPPLPFPSFPSSPLLPAAANIACGVLMSVGMHEVREPPRSSSPPPLPVRRRRLR